jgi:hypothetical protein
MDTHDLEREAQEYAGVPIRKLLDKIKIAEPLPPDFKADVSFHDDLPAVVAERFMADRDAKVARVATGGEFCYVGYEPLHKVVQDLRASWLAELKEKSPPTFGAGPLLSPVARSADVGKLSWDMGVRGIFSLQRCFRCLGRPQHVFPGYPDTEYCPEPDGPGHVHPRVELAPRELCRLGR